MTVTAPETKPAAPGIPRMVPEDWHTRTDVGLMVGRSRTTIKSWEAQGLIAPDGEMQVGKTLVRLYSTRYVNGVIKPLAGSIRTGPKPVLADAVA